MALPDCFDSASADPAEEDLREFQILWLVDIDGLVAWKNVGNETIAKGVAASQKLLSCNEAKGTGIVKCWRQVLRTCGPILREQRP